MVGCRNIDARRARLDQECIKRSDGGVSEQAAQTRSLRSSSVSSVPMVGCRNDAGELVDRQPGSVSSVPMVGCRNSARAPSAFLRSVSSVPMVGCRNMTRAEHNALHECIKRSDGGVSEQEKIMERQESYECIKRSDGGVSERAACHVYFGGKSVSSVPMVGCRNTTADHECYFPSVSSVPMVGCRNVVGAGASIYGESIKRSDGGVSEHVHQHIDQHP